jgi:hypothetical protein
MGECKFPVKYLPDIGLVTLVIYVVVLVIVTVQELPTS